MELTRNPCDDECVISIDLDQIDGIYDMLSKKLYTDLDKQYKEGKISGPAYQAAWVELMKSVVSGSLQAVVSIQNKETAADRALKAAQVEKIDQDIAASVIKSQNETCIATANCSLSDAKKLAEDIKNGKEAGAGSLYEKNKAVLDAQELLYVRQRNGFDDNARQKMLDSQISAWSIAWKDGSAIDIPCAISNSAITHALENINDDMGQEANNGPIPTDCTQVATGDEEPTPEPTE